MEDNKTSDDREKSLYLTQIQHLDKKLERCQLKCDELEMQNKYLVHHCRLLEEDKTDICEYLKLSATEKKKMADELAEKLAEKLETQRQAEEQDLKELKLQQSLETEELQEQVDKLKSQIKTHAARSEEQRQQKEQLKQQLKQQLCDEGSLEEELLCQKTEHQAVIKNLKEEIESEISSMTAEKEKSADDWSKTRILEVVQEEKVQHRRLKQQLKLMLENIKGLEEERLTAQRNKIVLSCVIEDLKEQSAKMEQEILTSKTKGEHLAGLSEEMKRTKERCVRVRESTLSLMSDLSQQLDSAEEEHSHKTAMASQLEAELNEARIIEARLEGDMKKAVFLLRHILEDSDEASETLLNQELLKVLKKNAPQGADSALRDSIETRSGGLTTKTSDPESDRAETLNLASDPLFLLARFQPGDLGVIPRPRWNLSSRCSVNLHPAASQQSVSTDPECPHTGASSSADC
ncbi:cilia- and flagella-associated protein 157-like [Notolabrus celidotus]|uniref:cilia- and flagella-associated protein 157-like n=1 Tax=Notolabrus celidotus TaxID=1203425 RepID=UPI00148FD89D|nr:cilia- and flagella-associated protein 157-like [Notolabrus celidotus]